MHSAINKIIKVTQLINAKTTLKNVKVIVLIYKSC